MIESFDDFIFWEDDVITQDQINDIISVVNQNSPAFDQFRLHQVETGTAGAPTEPTVRDDTTYFMSPHFNALDHLTWVNQIVEYGFAKYHEHYPFIWSKDSVYWQDFKHHIVKKHGGYHSWHHENNGNLFSGVANRILTWHLSLTTHEAEGELEFLYLGHRIEPKAGRLLIWPAGFTHVHRGNPIRGNTEKHYITGWYMSH
jgi:hypothetical protein